MMNTLVQDTKYALRMLAKSPGFTAIAVLTLALGIGANAAIFSVINATLLKPLPYPNTDRLVLVWQTYGGNGPDNINIVSALNMMDVQKQNTVLESMAWFDSAGKGYNLGLGDHPERVSGVRVTASFFHVLGVRPLLGRTFFPEEETAGKDHEVVLSYPLWQRRFSGDPAIIGKQIPIDGQSYTVVGVMPRTFDFQFWSLPRQLWVPVGYTKNDLTDRGSNSFVAIGRLKPGVSVAEAKADMETIGRRLATEYPKDDNPNRFSITAMPLAEYGMNDLRTTLWSLFAAVGFVLLIACVNIANLLLARGAGRQRELAVRCALGATRGRLVRQLITESLLMGFLGGVAGIIVALVGLDLVAPLLPTDLQYLPFRHVGGITMDGRVFIFALLLSCLTGVLFGLAPALSAQRSQIIDPLKEGAGRGLTSSGGNRLRHALVAAEVALALIVLAGAALMIDSMGRLLAVDPGLNPKNVLTMDVSTAQENLYVGPPADEQFCRQLTEHLGAIPGVLSVGAVAHLPLSGSNAGRGFTIEGRPNPGLNNRAGGNYSVACPNFFRTMGIPLVEGREFTDADTVNSAGVIVINQAMEHRYWPKGGALGAHIKLGEFNDDAPWLTVVGIVANFRHDGLDTQPRPHFYRPFTQAGWPFMTVVMRTTTAPASFEQAARRALAQMRGNYPASGVSTMEQIVSDSLGSRRFPMMLLSAFASLALILSAVGIAGVVGFAVAQRTHEIGIRMALGAQPRDVLNLVLRGSMAWTLGGVAVGIAGAVALTRLLGDLLYGVRPADPLILGATAVLLIAVALAATYFPARRATKVDPMVALRYE
ncbi:MAG TPA: ABC transporter permease [Verrucomicrobiae bacterium]|nr:ABC transporter permease [Verrucomicrobiae bacterium]